MPSPRILVAQTQRLALNSALSSAISVLRADSGALTSMLEEQAMGNPQLLVRPTMPSVWTPRWNDALSRLGRRFDSDEELASTDPSLIAHVSAEIESLRLPPEEIEIALAFASALAPTGWIDAPVSKIAAEAGVREKTALAVLQKLQQIEPVGLFARDLEECLRLQALAQNKLDAVMKVVLRQLALLASGQFGAVAALAGVSEAAVLERVRQLRRFDPKPGARFEYGATQVAEPDLMVAKGASGWEVSLNRSSLPSLSLASEPGPGRAAARAMIKLIEGRNATVLSVAREVMARQSAVICAGLSALVPMGMGDVAQALHLHQSTVSRVIAGTSIDTPRGTYWLRSLFSAAVHENGPSGAVLRGRLAQIIAEEDPKAPLSDAALAARLSEDGALLARRTIAKYRETLGIVAAYRRRSRS